MARIKNLQEVLEQAGRVSLAGISLWLAQTAAERCVDTTPPSQYTRLVSCRADLMAHHDAQQKWMGSMVTYELATKGGALGICAASTCLPGPVLQRMAFLVPLSMVLMAKSQYSNTKETRIEAPSILEAERAAPSSALVTSPMFDQAFLCQFIFRPLSSQMGFLGAAIPTMALSKCFPPLGMNPSGMTTMLNFACLGIYHKSGHFVLAIALHAFFNAVLGMEEAFATLCLRVGASYDILTAVGEHPKRLEDLEVPLSGLEVYIVRSWKSVEQVLLSMATLMSSGSTLDDIPMLRLSWIEEGDNIEISSQSSFQHRSGKRILTVQEYRQAMGWNKDTPDALLQSFLDTMFEGNQEIRLDQYMQIEERRLKCELALQLLATDPELGNQMIRNGYQIPVSYEELWITIKSQTTGGAFLDYSDGIVTRAEAERHWKQKIRCLFYASETNGSLMAFAMLRDDTFVDQMAAWTMDSQK